MLPGPVQFLGHRLRSDRRGHDLGVGVIQAGPSRGAMVFEDHGVLEPDITVQVPEPVLVDAQHLLDLYDIHISQVPVMVGSLHHYLVGPYPSLPVIKAYRPLLGIPLDGQRRVLVRL